MDAGHEELLRCRRALKYLRRQGTTLFADGSEPSGQHRRWARHELRALGNLAALAGDSRLPAPRKLARSLDPREVFFASGLPNPSGNHEPSPTDALAIVRRLEQIATLALGTRERHDAQRWLVKGQIVAALDNADRMPDHLRDWTLRFADDWRESHESSDGCLVGCQHCSDDPPQSNVSR